MKDEFCRQIGRQEHLQAIYGLSLEFVGHSKCSFGPIAYGLCGMEMPGKACEKRMDKIWQ